MASRVLLRLIDEAIIPAIVIFITKIVAVVILIQWMNAAWRFDTLSTIPNIVFEDASVMMFVNTYSNLAVFLVILFGLFWTLLKAYHLHETHINPSLLVRLVSWDLSKLITSSSEVYHKGLVWLSYMWLTIMLLGLQVFLRSAYLWSIAVALLIGIVATWFFIADIEREFMKETKS